MVECSWMVEITRYSCKSYYIRIFFSDITQPITGDSDMSVCPHTKVLRGDRSTLSSAKVFFLSSIFLDSFGGLLIQCYYFANWKIDTSPYLLTVTYLCDVWNTCTLCTIINEYNTYITSNFLWTNTNIVLKQR